MFSNSLPLADAAYSTLVKAILLFWAYGIFGAVILGAILSTYLATLNSASTLFALDFYKGIFKKNASESSIVNVGKLTNIIVAVVAIALVQLLVNALTGRYNFLQEYVGFYNIPLIVIILFCFFSRWASAVAAKVCFFAHIGLYILAKVLFADLHFLYIHSVLFFLDILIIWGYSKISPLATPFGFKTNTNKVDLDSWKYRKVFALIVVLGVFSLYAIFSPLGIAK